MRNRAASTLRLLGLAGATLLATGCAVFSPIQTDYAYIPADGVDLSIPGLTFRNLVVVADEEGGPGTLVGQAVNETAQAIDVTFALEGSSGTSTSIASYSDDAISLGSTPVTIGPVPEPPGSMMPLLVTTQEAGQNVVVVPVLPSTRYYDQFAPSSSPSPTPSPTGTPEADPEEADTTPGG